MIKKIKKANADKPHLYNLFMPHGFYIQVKKKAMREYKSLAEVVRELLEEWLNDN